MISRETTTFKMTRVRLKVQSFVFFKCTCAWKQSDVIQCEFRYSHSMSLVIKSHVSFIHKNQLHPNVWVLYCCCHNWVICLALWTGNFRCIPYLTQVNWAYQRECALLLSKYWTFNSDLEWLNRRTGRNRGNELLKKSRKETHKIYNKGGMGRNSKRIQYSFLGEEGKIGEKHNR